MSKIKGNCPQCGAPIYVQPRWWGMKPKPVTYSCNCNWARNRVVVAGDKNKYTKGAVKPGGPIRMSFEDEIMNKGRG